MEGWAARSGWGRCGGEGCVFEGVWGFAYVVCSSGGGGGGVSFMCGKRALWLDRVVGRGVVGMWAWGMGKGMEI